MFQCIESTESRCRLENRTLVQFGREEDIYGRFLGGIYAPLIVVNNSTLYLELSKGMNETKLSNLSDWYIAAAVIPMPEFKPESKIEDERKSPEAPELESQCIPNYELVSK